MRILGIIPARGGSKGVPGKNIKLLCGRPLLAYTAESALRARRLTRVILSTEDAQIAEVGKSLGLDVPFMRPQDLSLDTTPTMPVVLHAVTSLERAGESYDAVCLLQPTNPLRSSRTIDECVALFEQTDADSVITVLRVPDEFNPKWVYWQNADGALSLSTGESEPVSRRQDLPGAFHREGSVYVTKRTVLFQYGNLYGANIRGYETEPENALNIDTLDDWHRAIHRIQTRIAK